MISEIATKSGSEAVFHYQQTFNLSDTQLAYELGISEQSVKSYRFNSKNKRHPSESVVKLAKVLFFMKSEGLKIPD